LQNFLCVLSWDYQAVRDRLPAVVCRDRGHPHALGVIDRVDFDRKSLGQPLLQLLVLRIDVGRHDADRRAAVDLQTSRILSCKAANSGRTEW
jgi:hypothetical protein